MSRSTVVAAAITAALAGLLPAQSSAVRSISLVSPERIVAARASTSAFRIDGVLDEPLWRSVPSISSFLQQEPTEGAPATHATDARMIITDDAVIIAAKLTDEPSAFLATGNGRQPMSAGPFDDYFEVQIDAHASHLTALALSVSPVGVKRSSIVTRDGSRDESWNVQWDAVTHVDKDGWSLEIRLPLTELHIRPGAADWGVHFVRFSFARQETDVFGTRASRTTADQSR
jgi:hypothetical protein